MPTEQPTPLCSDRTSALSPTCVVSRASIAIFRHMFTPTCDESIPKKQISPKTDFRDVSPVRIEVGMTLLTATAFFVPKQPPALQGFEKLTHPTTD